MTILSMTAFLRTPMGKLTNFLLIIAILNLNSCTVYKHADTSIEQVRATDQVMKYMHIYNFFVHDDYNSYLLKNPVFNEDGSLSGQLELTGYQTPDSTWSKQEKREYWKNHKYDINIYSKTTLSDLGADVTGNISATTNTITIGADMIDKMTISSIDMEGELAAVAIVLLVVVGVIAVLSLLLILIAVAVDEEGEASSDGSGSGSDSGSGGSGSGSSG